MFLFKQIKHHHKTGASPQAKNSERSTAVRPSDNSRRTGTEATKEKLPISPTHTTPMLKIAITSLHQATTTDNHHNPAKPIKPISEPKTPLQPTPRDNEQRILPPCFCLLPIS
jgi:hypothetical protein